MNGQEIMEKNIVDNPTKNAGKAKIPMADRAVKTLADSIFKTLREEGCNPKDIIGVSSQLLSLVTSELEKK